MTIAEFEKYINELLKLSWIPPTRNLQRNETPQFTDPDR
jgi:hypothetical protein